jgi:adenosylcobinamide-GDP ribazoletransferase
VTANPALDLRAAATLLTRLPVGATADGRTGSAAFALVGALLGVVAGVPSALIGGTAPLVGAFMGLGLLAILTGALHLDGLADSADALAAPDATRAEAARKDPRIGSSGVTAIVLVLGVAAGALAALPAGTVIALTATAGAASRAVPAVAAPLLGRAVSASAPSGFGAWFAAQAGWGGAAVSLATVAVVTGAAWWIAAAAGTTGSGPASALAAALVGLLAGLLTVAVLFRRFGHLAGDFLGAGVEVAFAAGLAGAAVAGGLAR